MEENKKFLEGLEENLLLIPLVICIILVVVGFICRLAGASIDTATVFCNQASYYAYAWYVSIVLGVTVRKRMYLNIDAVRKLFPDRAQFGIAVLNEIFELIVIVFFFVFSFVVVKNALDTGEMNAAAPAIPAVTAYFAPIIGFGFSIFRKIERLVKEGVKA